MSKGTTLAQIESDNYEEPKPRITLTVKDVPEIKSWDVGESYEFTLKGKMISKSEGGWDGKRPLEGTFEVENAKDIETEEDSEDEEY